MLLIKLHNLDADLMSSGKSFLSSPEETTISLANRSGRPLVIPKPSKESMPLFANEPIPADEFSKMVQSAD